MGYEVRPKRAKNGQKSAKNVSVGSVLRSEVGSKSIKSRPKKIQPEKINPAKKKLIPAQLGKFFGSQVGPLWPSGGLRGHLLKSKMQKNFRRNFGQLRSTSVNFGQLRS